MIKYAKDKKIWVRTVTNASLLHLKDNYKKLIDTFKDKKLATLEDTIKKVKQSCTAKFNESKLWKK